MKKYRRIEVNAYRRRVTIVSGEWPQDIPLEVVDAQSAQANDEVSLNDTDLCEPIEPNSPEGQLILIEAVRSLERRLLPEARATICASENTLMPISPNFFYRKLQSFFQSVRPRVLRFARKEKWNDAAKQSVED